MPKFFAHHLLLTFFLGAAAGVLSIVAVVAVIARTSATANALSSGAPTCVGCNIPTETNLPPPTSVNTATGIQEPSATSTTATQTNITATDSGTVQQQVQQTNSGGGGEGGPTSVTEIPDPLVKILKPAKGAKISGGHVDVLVRGHAGYINRGTYKYFTTWQNWGFVHDGTSIGSRPSGNSYPCDENGNATGDSIYVSAWCVTFSFDTGNGNHSLTVWGSGTYQGGAKDMIDYSVSGVTPAPTGGNVNGGGTTVSRVGTLSAATEGYMYISGPKNGYIGYKRRIINLRAGNYWMYVYDKSGTLCKKGRFTITANKTTKLTWSGQVCK